jgi:hypothetical protein
VTAERPEPHRHLGERRVDVGGHRDVVVAGRARAGERLGGADRVVARGREHRHVAPPAHHHRRVGEAARDQPGAPLGARPQRGRGLVPGAGERGRAAVVRRAHRGRRVRRRLPVVGRGGRVAPGVDARCGEGVVSGAGERGAERVGGGGLGGAGGGAGRGVERQEQDVGHGHLRP